MRLRRFAGHLDLPVDRLPRFLVFLALAVSIFAAHALVRTVAEALFLVHAGAASLPLYFVCVFFASAPAAVAIARLIDRIPRGSLMKSSLIGAAAVIAALSFVARQPSKVTMLAVLIGVVLVEILVVMQFWVLLSDYFTVLEQKRVVPALTLALAAGGMLGGVLANGLVRVVSAPAVLLALVPLYAAAYLLISRLQRSATSLQGADEGEAGEGLWASLRALPGLARAFPIVGLLPLVGFLDIVLGAFGAYLSYAIYESSFPTEREMTAFLGALRAVLCVTQVVLIYAVTRPLIRRLGAGRLNMVYPVTTLASFTALVVSSSVPAAVLANANFDTVSSGINNPVENLTYNAVPPRFLGRVRAISEGILQPSGLAACGLTLFWLQERLSYRELALAMLGLSSVHVVLGWWRGREYGRALAAQLAARSIDLGSDDDMVTGGVAQLGPGYAAEIDALLLHPDPEVRALALDLAARAGPKQYLSRLEQLAPTLDERGREAAVRLLTAVGGGRGRRWRRRVLGGAGSEALRGLALEATAARGEDIPKPLLAAAFAAGPTSAGAGWAIAAALSIEPPVGYQPDREAARAAVRLASARRIPRLARALALSANDPDATVRRRALEALAGLAPTHLAPIAAAARAHLADADPGVRGAALGLLAREEPEAVERLAAGLEDTHGAVRRRAGEALATVGPAALPWLIKALGQARPDVMRAALRGLGRMGSQPAAEAAFDFLRRDFEAVAELRPIQDRLPRDAAWRPLRAAIADLNQRTIERVLLVLEAFGHERTLRHARTALRSKDPRLRANAVEALHSLPQRRFVAPVLRLLEASAGGDQNGDAPSLPIDFEHQIVPLLEHQDRWLRSGAAAVARALNRPAPPLRPEDETMSRLLFLKEVPLFSGLTLENLITVDAALRRADYLEGETVFEQGSVGDDFYLVSSGEVAVRVGDGTTARELARLGPGEFFGEMALFDDEPRSATCVTTRPTTLLVLDRQRFYSLLEQQPRLGVEICRMLSLRLRRAGSAGSAGRDAGAAAEVAS